MAAAWLAIYGLNVRIIDKRTTGIEAGQADGLQSRTLEILDSLGIGNGIWKESNKMFEMCMWSPDAQGIITRTSRMIDTVKNISRFQQATLHQGRIEEAFLKLLRERGNVEVERCTLPVSLVCDKSSFSDDEAYPVTMKLLQLDEDVETRSDRIPPIPNGLFRSNLTQDTTNDLIETYKNDGRGESLETVRAKYVIGCDGAHSWIRNQVGISLEGEQTDYVWFVSESC